MFSAVTGESFPAGFQYFPYKYIYCNSRYHKYAVNCGGQIEKLTASHACKGETAVHQISAGAFSGGQLNRTTKQLPQAKNRKLGSYRSSDDMC